jgi:hypothetical protein
MKTRTGAAPRTAAAHAARRRKTQAALERVRQSIVRLQREKAQVSVAAVARRAEVSRTFLYGNAEAREMIAEAIIAARARQNQRVVGQDDTREAAWRERALNAEQALNSPTPRSSPNAPASANSSARSATWKPTGPRKPSSASPRRTPPSNSASANSPPTTAPSTNASRPPAPTCVSKTAASPISKPRSPAPPGESNGDAVGAQRAWLTPRYSVSESGRRRSGRTPARTSSRRTTKGSSASWSMSAAEPEPAFQPDSPGQKPRRPDTRRNGQADGRPGVDGRRVQPPE